uniref:LysE family translocator n=1 Tax=Desulfogranum japonicum TaxID=231447 RepID=UPI002FC2FB92
METPSCGSEKGQRLLAFRSIRCFFKKLSFENESMFDIHNYNSFLLAIIVFQLIPGPGTLAIVQAAASGGFKSGMYAVYGTLLGDCIYMSSALLGLATLLQNFPFVLEFAQFTGAIYLLFIGSQKLFEKIEKVPENNGLKKKDLKVLKEALAICLTNPKAIMFFMAFFPLFLAEDSNSITLFAMMIHVTIISAIYQTCLVLMGNSAAKLLSQWKYSKTIATRLAGIAFIAFGAKLARNIK